MTFTSGDSKNCKKKREFPILYVKNSKKINWEFPFLVLKTIKNFGNFMSSYTLATKKVLNFLEFPMKNEGKIFGSPMSSLGGVHLMFGIAQFDLVRYCSMLQWFLGRPTCLL